MTQINRAPPFPRLPLLSAGALIGFVIIAAAAVKLTGQTDMPPESTAVAERDLRFADRPDGGIAVYQGQETEPLEVLTGQQGFLRGTLRGLVRYRKREGIGPDVAFRLTAWADKRLTLDDPTTGRHIELVAFGPTNEAVFVDLMRVHRPAVADVAATRATQTADAQ